MLRAARVRCQAAAAATGGFAGGSSTGSGGSAAGGKAKKPSPLKTVDDYMKMDSSELRKLIGIRDEQVKQLKDLHERSHRSCEYYHRLQILDYDEKSVQYAEVAGKMNSDKISVHRHKLVDLRILHDMGGRDKGIVIAFCFFGLLLWWSWLMFHYPKKNKTGSRDVVGSSKFTWGNAFNDGRRWSAKSVMTPYQKELASRPDADAIAAEERAAVDAKARETLEKQKK